MLKRNQKAKRATRKRGIMPSERDEAMPSRKRVRPETLETVGGEPAPMPVQAEANRPALCIHEADPDTAIQSNWNSDYAVIAIAKGKATRVAKCRLCHALFVPEAA